MSANVKNYMKQGGEVLVIGGTIVPATEIQAGNIVAAKTDYTTGDLDTEAEVIVATNLTNTKLNAVIAALKAVGILASA
jgi:hypothetical protein